MFSRSYSWLGSPLSDSVEDQKDLKLKKGKWASYTARRTFRFGPEKKRFLVENRVTRLGIKLPIRWRNTAKAISFASGSGRNFFASMDTAPLPSMGGCWSVSFARHLDLRYPQARVDRLGFVLFAPGFQRSSRRVRWWSLSDVGIRQEKRISPIGKHMSPWVINGIRRGIKTAAYPTRPEGAVGVTPKAACGRSNGWRVGAALLERCPTEALGQKNDDVSVDYAVVSPLRWQSASSW
jgi:hypothetical protein